MRSKDDKSKIRLGETLQMRIETEPEYANNVNVRWSVLDQSGDPSSLARIGFDGVLYPAAAGTVIVKAELRSDRSISATREIRIVDSEPVLGDVTGDGEVTAADVVKLRALIQSGLWTEDELAAGDLNRSGRLEPEDAAALLERLHILPGDISGDGKTTALDIMSIRKAILKDQLTEEVLAAGDLSGDGRLNALDIMLLRKIMLT